MTYHTIDFSFVDVPCCKRLRPSFATIMPSSTSAAAPVESFGWGDFPLMTTTVVSEDESSLHNYLPTTSNSSSSSSSRSSKLASCKMFASMLEYDIDHDPQQQDTPEHDSELEDDENVSTQQQQQQLLLQQQPQLQQSSRVSTTSPTRRRSVSFGTVQVREYNVILGVHPLAAGGFPLELGWDYNEITTQRSVDAYEQERHDYYYFYYSYDGYPHAKRHRPQLRRLSAVERQYKLAALCYGGDLGKVADAERVRRQEQECQQNEESSLEVADYNDDTYLSSEYTQGEMLRCTSYPHLSSLA